MAALLHGVNHSGSFSCYFAVCDLCSQDLFTVQYGCWSPNHHVLSSSHRKKEGIKKKETKSTYQLSFQEGSQNLLLLIGQNLGTWPHLDGRHGNVFFFFFFN